MKQRMLSEMVEKLSSLGIRANVGNGTDLSITAEFLDAGWSTGSQKISYEASAFLDESSQTVWMWEKTTETGRGLSFGGDLGSSFQSGKTLFRKVKSIQYGPDGKAYEYSLDLGAIPQTIHVIAKQYGWKFKTILSRDKASYPPRYAPLIIQPQPQAHETNVLMQPEFVHPQTPAYTMPTTSQPQPVTPQPQPIPVQQPAYISPDYQPPMPEYGMPMPAQPQAAPQVPVYTQPQPVPGFCPVCGTPVITGANFCQKCGMDFNAMGPAVQIPPSISANYQQPVAHQYSDPQGTFYAQSQPAASKKDAGKPSGFSAFIFWSVWALLSLFCLTMFADRASFLRFLGFTLILVLPLILRKRLFQKIIPSLSLWFLTYVLFFMIIAITDSSGTALTRSADLAVQKEGKIAVYTLNGVVPDGAKISMTKDANPPAPPMDGIAMDAYDITLPQGSAMVGAVEIDLPFDKNMLPWGERPEDILSAAYFDPAKNEWTSVAYVVDAGRGLITIMTDHFSKYAVVYFKDGRKKLTEKLPEFDGLPTAFYSDDELQKIVGGMAGGSDENLAAATAAWNQFNTYYGLTGATGNVLTAAVDSKTLSHVNDLMTEAGLGFAFAQIALDMANGDNKAAVNNFIKNAANYGAAKWGGAAVNLASAGVTFMDIAINKYAEKALDKNLQKWEDAYRHYYETNPKIKRTAVDWYKIVKTIHSQSSSSEDFKAKLDAEITGYADLFWKDAEGYAYVAESTPGLRGFGAGGEFAQGVAAVSGNYKNFIYQTTMKPVMEVYMKNLWLLESRRADAKFKKLRDEMNKEYTVTITLSNFQQVQNLGRTMVRFRNEKGQVVHSQSFDASGRAAIRFSLFSFLKAGGPARIEVRVPSQGDTPEFNTTLTYKLDHTNIVLNTPYAPTQTPPSQEKPAKRKPESQPVIRTESKPVQMTEKPIVQQPKQETPKQPEYNYNAALSAWAADFAAEVNRRNYDDGNCRSTYRFEWVSGPVIQNGQVVGASKVWETDLYYNGPNKGKTTTFVANESFDAGNPGAYISLGDLKRKYPQFGN